MCVRVRACVWLHNPSLFPARASDPGDAHFTSPPAPDSVIDEAKARLAAATAAQEEDGAAGDGGGSDDDSSGGGGGGGGGGGEGKGGEVEVVAAPSEDVMAAVRDLKGAKKVSVCACVHACLRA